MTTDRDIPERWRTECDLSSQSHIVRRSLLHNMAVELGTAESLVRELAQALQAICAIPQDDSYETDVETIIAMHHAAHAALSRIPAHLRAPETTHKETSK